MRLSFSIQVPLQLLRLRTTLHKTQVLLKTLSQSIRHHTLLIE